ncbi:DUF881 domain-containing protein [Pseudokineococcus sp. 1T1Z-3]|uniref:DUF881 domain-containing protein n=1 Tax=Pseudokineococcus sp. 1T1Z-3 TaxID=3132745 RepID=UPI0030AFEB60
MTGRHAAGQEPEDVRPVRRPDASMVLLQEVMERPLDPAYAAAAARRGAAGSTSGRSRRAVVLTVALGVAAGLVTVLGVVDLRAPSAAGTTAALRAQVEERQGEVGVLEGQVAQARTAVRRAEDAILGPAPGADGMQALALTTGEVAVVGPGLRLVVDDAPSAGADASGSPRTDAQADAGRVRDRDLQVLVDGLWSAGAQAVSVGGQRLSARTAIRGAGEAVLVGYQPLAPPYEVLAVGAPGDLAAGFARSAGGRYAVALAEYGITVDVTREDEVLLPAASGLRPELARPLGGEDGS